MLIDTVNKMLSHFGEAYELVDFGSAGYDGYWIKVYANFTLGDNDNLDTEAINVEINGNEIYIDRGNLQEAGRILNLIYSSRIR